MPGEMWFTVKNNFTGIWQAILFNSMPIVNYYSTKMAPIPWATWGSVNRADFGNESWPWMHLLIRIELRFGKNYSKLDPQMKLSVQNIYSELVKKKGKSPASAKPSAQVLKKKKMKICFSTSIDSDTIF